MSIKKIIVSLLILCFPYVSYCANPAIIYTPAGKFNSPINEEAYRDAVIPFGSLYGKDVAEETPTEEQEFVPLITRLAQQGRSPIVGIGFHYADAIADVAAKFPETQFTIVDARVDLPNVQSIMYSEHEGSFLVGALAALKSQSEEIGYVGAMDIPYFRRYACGYAQGAHYINSKIKVHMRMAAKDISGFTNPDLGYSIGNDLINKGSDVIYATAGNTGLGVYKAAARDDRVFAIGVDTNQNFLHIGTMLTSMVKFVGPSILDTWKESEEGTWRGGVKNLGLAEHGVDWALDIFNRNLVSAKEEKKINKIRQDIIDGNIVVADYMATNSCPVPLIP